MQYGLSRLLCIAVLLYSAFDLGASGRVHHLHGYLPAKRPHDKDPAGEADRRQHPGVRISLGLDTAKAGKCDQGFRPQIWPHLRGPERPDGHDPKPA